MRIGLGRTRGFTLIELLVVLVVLAVLIGLAIPALGWARESGRRMQCLANLRALAMAARAYADQHDQSLPYADRATDVRTGDVAPFGALAGFLDAPLPTVDAKGVVRTGPPYRCPSDRELAVRDGFSYAYSIYDVWAWLALEGRSLDLGKLADLEPSMVIFLERDVFHARGKATGEGRARAAAQLVSRLDGSAGPRREDDRTMPRLP